MTTCYNSRGLSARLLFQRVRGRAQSSPHPSLFCCRCQEKNAQCQRFRKLWNRGGYLAEGWIISGLCPPVGGSGRGGPREEERVFCRRRIIGRNAPGGARRFKLVHRLSWSPSVGVRRDRPEAGPSH